MNLVETLGLTALLLDEDEATASAQMTITEALLNPWGIVHGAAWAGAIEMVAGVGASALVASRGMFAAGLDCTIDFVHPATEGVFSVAAHGLHTGGRTQLWGASIIGERGNLIAHGRVRFFNTASPTPAVISS